MNKEDVILIYKKAQSFPSFVNIAWLRSELEPILKEINPEIRISWACNSCVKSQMSILYGWLEKQQKEKQVTKKITKRKTSKKNNAKKQTKK